MKEVMYNEYAKEVLEALPKGAFLNVSDGTIENTMTIAWGNIGFMWRKPVITIMVRYSRYTYELLEKSDCFTLSIPLKANLKDALKYCGSVSGRDHDKWQGAGLTKVKAHLVNAPLVDECDLHYECKIIGKMPLVENALESDINSAFYANGDYHVLYYGEILGTYVK
ncbi:MAG: flavin reductase family protein [Cellulosilyticaceae bacterium]